jgi:hypothetical protein
MTRVNRASGTRRTTNVVQPAHKNIWRMATRCGVKSVCILGGAIGGAVTGTCAAALLIKQLLNDPDSHCGPGMRGSCMASPRILIFTAPLVILGSAASTASVGAVVGNRIANRILNQT